jgi:hypothetical protein
MAATTQRMQEALDRLETRRVEIEARILADLERKFFATEDSDAELTIDHFPTPSPTGEDTAAYMGTPFSFTWYGIG